MEWGMVKYGVSQIYLSPSLKGVAPQPLSLGIGTTRGRFGIDIVLLGVADSWTRARRAVYRRVAIDSPSSVAPLRERNEEGE